MTTAKDSGGGPILFEPHKIPASQFPHYDALQSCVDNIPRFLFRVTGPESAGITDATEVCSRAWLNGAAERSRDLFAPAEGFSPHPIAQRLEDHLLWLYRFDSNLVSWTSSLLFALHYAVHRSHGGEPPGELFILAVDTTQFPRGALIRDYEPIDAFRTYSSIPADVDGLRRLHGWRSGTHYFGEYLSQGRLPLDPGRCCRVSLEAVRGAGLAELFPGLWDKGLPATWSGAVLMLRERIESAAEGVRGVDVLRAVAVAERFPDERFRVPVAVMVLGLCPRRIGEGDGVLLREGMMGFRKSAGLDACYLSTLLGSQGWSPFSPEIERYHRLLRMLYDSFKESDDVGSGLEMGRR